MIYLDQKLNRVLAGRDPFDYFHGIHGTIYRQLEGRCTKRVEIEKTGYFVKMHYGVGWGEILKNLLQFRAPVISAANEWRALERMNSLGIATMTVAAYGIKGRNPARVNSFIVTDELVDTVSLEDFCAGWRKSPPGVKLKWQLIDKVADISRRMHENGICHRDFYICHFLLHRSSLDAEPVLSVIDLHRALVKTGLSSRWLEKDIAGLYFSSMDIGLTSRDRLRFVRRYSGGKLRSSLSGKSGFWKRIHDKAMALYRKHGPNKEAE